MVLQDVLKTFWRRLQDVFAKRLPKMSSRRTCKTSSSRRIEDVLQLYLEDVLKDKKMLHWRRLQYLFTKTTVCLVRYCFVQKIVSVKLHFRYLTGFRILLCLCYLVFTKTPFIPLNNILSNWRPFSHLVTRKSLKRKYFSIFFQIDFNS